MPGFDTVSTMLPNAPIPSVSDAAYGAAWNNIVSTSPSQSAFYKKAETLAAQTSVIINTYTPTASNLANISSLTLYLAEYARFGDYVFVIGGFTGTIAAGSTAFNVSLPIASDIQAVGQLGGCSGIYKNTTGSPGVCIFGDVANNNARVGFNLAVTGTTNYVPLLFGYQVK